MTLVFNSESSPVFAGRDSGVAARGGQAARPACRARSSTAAGVGAVGGAQRRGRWRAGSASWARPVRRSRSWRRVRNSACARPVSVTW